MTKRIICAILKKLKEINIIMPEWWNGRHDGLKIRWIKFRVGSNPSSGIYLYSLGILIFTLILITLFSLGFNLIFHITLPFSSTFVGDKEYFTLTL